MFANPETWVSASFILFVALLIYLKVPQRLAKMLDSRSQAIAKQLEDAKQLREEAEALLAQYRNKISNAQAEADAILAQAEREAELYSRDVRSAFDEMLNRRTAQAELKIKQEEEKARKQIRAQAAELAVAAATHILKQKITGLSAEAMTTASLERIKKSLH